MITRQTPSKVVRLHLRRPRRMLLARLTLTFPIRSSSTVYSQSRHSISEGIKKSSSTMIKRTSAVSEIIDDSEPEREELRHRQKEERTKKRFGSLELQNSSAQKASGT